MKTLTSLISLVLAVALVASACSSDSAVTNNAAQPEPTESATNNQAGERIETLWIGPQLVDCVGVVPQKCMEIRRAADGQVEWFYDSIEGFDHMIGTSYQIKVAVTDVENPPADASSLHYRLVEVVEATVESATAGLDGTTWQLRGFRDGDLFDPVPQDVEITLSFDGDSVHGSSGCNSYTGTLAIDGDVLNFGPLAGTKKLCPPEIMEYEDRFLATMGTIETAQITFDGALVLAPTTGMTLLFGAVG